MKENTSISFKDEQNNIWKVTKNTDNYIFKCDSKIVEISIDKIDKELKK